MSELDSTIPNQELATFSNIYDELDIDRESIGKDTKHGYRIIMYNKLDVEFMEKRVIKEMLEKNPNIKYSDTFLLKAYNLFPERFPELASKKKRGKNIAIKGIEETGGHSMFQARQ